MSHDDIMTLIDQLHELANYHKEQSTLFMGGEGGEYIFHADAYNQIHAALRFINKSLRKDQRMTTPEQH